MGQMIRLRNRLGAWVGREARGGWSVALVYVAALDPWLGGAVGWGYDKHNPLRPWPHLHRYTDQPRRCASCCGFFVTWTSR